VSLLEDQIWIEDRDISIEPGNILSGPRIGIEYAAEDAARPYRFRVEIDDLCWDNSAGVLR
jgi:DNA-3-methyladenine glycosylase